MKTNSANNTLTIEYIAYKWSEKLKRNMKVDEWLEFYDDCQKANTTSLQVSDYINLSLC